MRPSYLVQDIETIPESEVASLWKPSEEEIKKANGHPFPPVWAHKVLNIGVLVLDERFHPVRSGCAAGGLLGKKSEAEMIERWSDIASGEFFRQPASLMIDTRSIKPLKLVDYNGRAFDVPVLQCRAMRYGIDMGWYFGKVPDMKGGISSFSKGYRDRYADHHLDVVETFTNFGAFAKPKLEVMAKLIGLPGKTGIDGTQTYQAWKEERFADLDLYVMEDVYQTAFVFLRLKLIAGEVGAEEYVTAAKALWVHIAAAAETGGVSSAFFDGTDKDRLFSVWNHTAPSPELVLPLQSAHGESVEGDDHPPISAGG